MQKANEILTREVVRSLDEGGGTLREADSRVNHASRSLITACLKKNGSAWVGKINRYPADKDKPILCEVKEGDTIYNFGADFVIPVYDQILENLIREWNNHGVSVAALLAMHLRVDLLKGYLLYWS